MNNPPTYTLVMAACVQFVILTLVAMLFYPGGTLTDPTTSGYSFLNNFFSDLGLTASYSGAPNHISSALFITALTLAGLGLILFFMTFPDFFSVAPDTLIVSWLGTLFGVICGFSFIGVAFTPADRFFARHVDFVHLAFSAFLLVVLLYSIAIYRHPSFPRVYAGVLLLFAALLAAYLWLLFFGPSAASPQGILIQAVGQKVIVYATIGVMLIVANGARQQAARYV